MDTADIVAVISRAILECNRTLTESAAALQATLRHWADVVRAKAQDDVFRKEDTEFETKLRAARRHKVDRKRTLTKLRTSFREEIKFVDEIVAQNCALIIQQQQSHQKLTAKERTIAQYKIAAKEKTLQEKQKQVYEMQLSELKAELEEARVGNMLEEKDQRNYWNNKKDELNDVLLKYDTTMFAQEEELEVVRTILDQEAEELHNFKRAYAAQENPYKELMREKEEYLEQQRQLKLFEIRLRIAKRTIVKFIEDHYPAWKKKKLKASRKRGKYRFNLNKKK